MYEVSCDKGGKKNKRCGKKAYVEVYYKSSTCGAKGEPCSYGCTLHWSYLCFKHFVLDLIKKYLFKTGNGYCYVSDEKTLLKRLLDKKDYSEE